MAHSGISLARRRICNTCEHRCALSAAAHDLKWAEFCAHAGLGHREAWSALSLEFLEGPESNCPAGHWDGVGPLDLEAEQEKERLQKADRQAAELTPVLREALEGATAEKVQSTLDDLVTAGRVEPEAAADIEEAILGTTT
ncbi:MAG: hypothetical protein ACOC7T_05690 [Planctomycetota bacterium]